MVDQMMGNASGGGIQLGRLRSRMAVRSSAILGRDASIGLNTRLRRALNRNQTNTIAVWSLGSRPERLRPWLSQHVR